MPQRVHTLVDREGAYVPRVQSKHLSVPLTGANFPSPQSTHTVLPARLDLPRMQSVQLPAPGPLLKVPGGHCMCVWMCVCVCVCVCVCECVNV